MSVTVISEIRKLLGPAGPAELGPGPRAGVLSETALAAKLDVIFREARLPFRQQQLIRSLLLLWHDHLDASHTISQGIENADGSFLHAIMHRREPDAWNSKYWWRRVGHHPAFPEIARRAGEFLAGSRRREEADLGRAGNLRLLTSAATSELAKQLIPGGKWDPVTFVDACDLAKDATVISTLREVQRIETEVLLERFCHE
jgi:hypothetical protein